MQDFFVICQLVTKIQGLGWAESPPPQAHTCEKSPVGLGLRKHGLQHQLQSSIVLLLTLLFAAAVLIRVS